MVFLLITNIKILGKKRDLFFLCFLKLFLLHEKRRKKNITEKSYSYSRVE